MKSEKSIKHCTVCGAQLLNKDNRWIHLVFELTFSIKSYYECFDSCGSQDVTGCCHFESRQRGWNLDKISTWLICNSFFVLILYFPDYLDFLKSSVFDFILILSELNLDRIRMKSRWYIPAFVDKILILQIVL